MFTYAVKVRFYDEIDNKLDTRGFFTFNNNISEAYQMAVDFYGIENIDFISIEVFDSILDFDEETFQKIQKEELEDKKI